jgi:hypothetical protein
MSYFVLIRTQSGKLAALVEDDDSCIKEWEDKQEAEDCAMGNLACMAGNYEIIDAPV